MSTVLRRGAPTTHRPRPTVKLSRETENKFHRNYEDVLRARRHVTPMASVTATRATPSELQSQTWSLPSIDTKASLPSQPVPSSKKRGGRSRSLGRSRHNKTGSKKSGGTTSDNRWTSTEIADYFGFDPNKSRPSLSSASSVFPSSRYGESCVSKSAGSRCSSTKSYMSGLMLDRDRDDAFRDRAQSVGSSRSGTDLDMSTWTTVKYHYEPDYEEKKKRVLKGKFREQLTEYFPDLTPKRKIISWESEDDAYDTDLDSDLGEELMAEERAQLNKELGSYPEYKRLCRKYQVVPNSYFLRSLGNDDMNLNYRYLSFGDSYTLAKEIANQPSISYLNLEDNAIGPAGMLCFADMLMKNSYLCEVNLSDNGLGVMGARLLKKVLVKNARLVVVNISGNKFGERGAKYLADIIDRNDTIRHLYMSHNAIGDSGATLIGKALGNNVTLRTLDLSWNHIRTKGALGFGKGIKNNSSLEVLGMAMNGLHVEGTRLLLNGLRGNVYLRELDLSANRIDVEGAKAVARTLPHLLGLLVLKLAFNPLKSEGAEAIVKALMNCPFSPIEYVDFEGVTLEDYFTLLAEELMQQRDDTEMTLLYSIPPSSRERSIDLPIETLTQLTDLLDEEEVEVRELFKDVPEDDQLILSTEDLFSRVQKSGRIHHPEKLARLKRSAQRDLRRRFLLKDLLLLSTPRRQSHLATAHTAHALDTPELREVQNAWRYPRPRSSYVSPFDELAEGFTPDSNDGSRETFYN